MRRLALLIGPLMATLSFTTLSFTTLARGADLVAEGASIKKLADGFMFTEGPAVAKNGDIYFSDIPNSRIHRWSEGKLSVFREKTGRANGLYFAKDGRLLACEGGNRQLTATTPDGKVTVLVKSYKGKRFNSPNDLWIDPRGGVYFTDPRYGDQGGREIDGFHVYYLPPGKKEAVRVIDDLKKPNGVIGTADGKRLYVADPGDRKTYSYEIGKDGALSNRKLHYKQGSDGMTLDERGNLYLTSGAVLVISPQGKLLQEIKVPEGPANVCFGGKDRKTLYITARRGFYSLRMSVRGQ